MSKDYDVPGQIRREINKAIEHVLSKPKLQKLILDIGGEYTNDVMIHVGQGVVMPATITINQDDLVELLGFRAGPLPAPRKTVV